MLSPELTLTEVEQAVDVARAELHGATMAQDEAERALDNLRREVDEKMTARTAASSRYYDAQALLRMRQGLPIEVVRMRKEYGALWTEVNASQNGEPTPAQSRKSEFLAKEMQQICTHPHVIAFDDGVQENVQERECVICMLREYVRPTTALLSQELRDMPGREVLITSDGYFAAFGAECVELPDYESIKTKFEAAVRESTALTVPPAKPVNERPSDPIVGDGESG